MDGITVGACTLAQCADHPLLYNSSTGKYGYALGISSGFFRKIQVIPNYSGNSNETQITSTVYWNQGSGTYNISFSEVLYNWMQ
jgi:hypothetical protein